MSRVVIVPSLIASTIVLKNRLLKVFASKRMNAQHVRRSARGQPDVAAGVEELHRYRDDRRADRRRPPASPCHPGDPEVLKFGAR
jgi:hypothetical protein